MIKLGLALSGGGTRCFAELGVLKALNENKVPVYMISGTSGGALVGAFYCKGYDPEEVLLMIQKQKFYKFIRPAISRKGLLKIQKAEALLKEFFPENSFESLNIPLVVAATDLITGKSVYYSEGPLILPLLGSSAVPVIFEPVIINGDLIADGGILNNLPVEPLLAVCDKVIGVHCNPINNNFGSNKLNMRTLLERSLLMAISYNSYDRAKHCDLFIEPAELENFRVFDYKSSRKVFEIGYNCAVKKMPEILNLLEK